jgi:RNA polymerase sigma-70 factor (ECF subfamily)
MVLALGENSDNEAGRRALEELCEIYWRPLYANARRQGQDPQSSEDLTQGFLLHALQNSLLNKADKSRGTMRTYLLALFKNYIHAEWRTSNTAKKGGGAHLFSLEQLQETEGHLANLQCDARSPEALYEYECSLATVEAALNKLAKGEHESGRGHVFEELRGLLDCADMTDDSQQQIAVRLGISHGAVRQTLLRLRKRLRDCLRDSVRDTLANPSDTDVDEELRHLKEVLGEGRPTIQ